MLLLGIFLSLCDVWSGGDHEREHAEVDGVERWIENQDAPGSECRPSACETRPQWTSSLIAHLRKCVSFFSVLVQA